MASRDEWFSIFTGDSGEGSLTKSGAPRRLGGGFRVDPEAAPAIRTAFEEAVGEMRLAQKAMRDMQYMRGGSVNPVVDKYLGALAEMGYGDNGSVTIAADSAVAEYQNVMDQLDRVMGEYTNSDAAAEGRQRRLQS